MLLFSAFHVSIGLVNSLLRVVSLTQRNRHTRLTNPFVRGKFRDLTALGAEAFDLIRRAVESLTNGFASTVDPLEVRRRVRKLLGRDSESLKSRMFARILSDAHDEGVITVRIRGNTFQVTRRWRDLRT